MKKNFYISGDWNIICDSCGKKMKASHAKHRWDGFIVCNSCYEYRHPQDYIKTKPDRIVVPFIRPYSNSYLDVNFAIETRTCTPMSKASMSELGVADCATVGTIINGYL
jgi:hypothetical protein